MIQVGNTGMYFDDGHKGFLQIYFDCRSGRVPRLFYKPYADFVKIDGENVDCSGEIFKILLDWMPCTEDNERFLRNHEILIKECIKKQFNQGRRMVECYSCGLTENQENLDEDKVCPPMGISPDWHEENVSTIPTTDISISTECVPVTYLKDLDMRSKYIYGLHMICRIKSIKNPIVMRNKYEQECVLFDNNTSKTLKAILSDKVADYDMWHKGDLIEARGVYEDGQYHIVWMKLLEEDNCEPIPINRNDETPGYNDWRTDIIKRDEKCVCCGFDKHLQAHHLFGYKENPELATHEHNGVTLCKFCHDKYHSVYGLKNINPVDFMNFIKKYGVR